ncbi:hypothetical protein [Rhodococcoides yunnanense]|uniref:hypothetical protein n=1 Tax=Rhodococcoides yunnanense TaxID=278209 RepID=UPI001114D0BC|nr:hypothetical protein [Rhodococcus yunnanensis]
MKGIQLSEKGEGTVEIIITGPRNVVHDNCGDTHHVSSVSKKDHSTRKAPRQQTESSLTKNISFDTSIGERRPVLASGSFGCGIVERPLG